MTRRSLSRVAAPGVLVAAAIVAACSEAGTGPGGVAAVSFDTLPSPGIVIGDTLRDANGNVAALTAHAFDVDGDEVEDAPIRWIALSRDTSANRERDSLAVDSVTGIVTAPALTDSAMYARRGASVRVLPQVNGLPGPVRQLVLTLRPDWLATADSALGLFTAQRADTSGRQRSSEPIPARVLHDSAGVGDTLPVRAWRVSYAVEYRGNVMPADSRAIWLVDDSFRRSATDTTDAEGRASRRVRVHPDSLGLSPGAIDTITVIISASWRGAPLAGSPQRLKLPVRPSAAAAR